MNCTIIKRAKIFFISALVVLVAGFTFFGIFGFNQTIDYKSGYELQVCVNQKAGNVLDVMNDATTTYFSENGLKPLNFATQTFDDGMMVVYKFNTDVTEAVKNLNTFVQTALDNETTVRDVLAEVSVKQVVAKSSVNVGKLILALSISVVAIFVYALIFEKLAGAVSVVFTAVLSALLFMAFMGITRIPASPFATISGVISVLLAGIISIATVNKYKAEYKKANKDTNAEIVDKVATGAKRLYILVASAVLLSAVSLCVLGTPYLMIAGAQVVLAGICGITSAIFGAPFMWCLIKKNK